MRKPISPLFVIVLVVLISTPLYGRRRNTGADRIQAVQLPADYAIDSHLASTGRSVMLRGSPPIFGTPLNQVKRGSNLNFAVINSQGQYQPPDALLEAIDRALSGR